jgi:hypothetical protein
MSLEQINAETPYRKMPLFGQTYLPTLFEIGKWFFAYISERGKVDEKVQN